VTGSPLLPLLAELSVAGQPVAEYVDGATLPPELSPRPFLHPVRTLAGVVVSAVRPEDHRWHLGVGVAVQDVDGFNLWGGRTYVRGKGYVWRGDHGSIRQVRLTGADPGGFVAELEWRDASGEPLLREIRGTRGTEVPEAVVPGAWQLDLTSTLVNDGDRTIALGSPATNGRPGGGYGGFFWRLPALADVHVRTPEADGEEAVHARPARWLAVTGSADGQLVTLVAAQPGARRPDPWFVRVAGYPGFGASLAAERPVRLVPGERLDRHLRVVVADGAPDPRPIADLLADAAGQERMDP
jgi:Family of unknown function (DUF6807)